MANWGRVSNWFRSVDVLNSMSDKEWPRSLHFCLCFWNIAGIWHNEINSDGHLREGTDLHCSLCFGPDFLALCRRETGGIMIFMKWQPCKMCGLAFNPAESYYDSVERTDFTKVKWMLMVLLESPEPFKRCIPLSLQEHIPLENSFFQCPKAYALTPRHINQWCN